MTVHDEHEAHSEAQSGIDRERQGSPLPAIEQGPRYSAESGIEFKNQDSVTFDLKNLHDCRFLFGKYGDKVYANEHNQNSEASFVIAEVDAKTNTITIRPC